MKIFVKSAGTAQTGDYGWMPELPYNSLEDTHRLLCEQDKAFALVAGQFESFWYIEFRNLLLPDVRDDIAGRQIVLNIVFSELRSEKEVRALALAYLDFELKVKSNGRPIARFQSDLAKAYRPTNDGYYQYDTDAAECWAKSIIEKYALGLESQSPGGEVRFSVSSETCSEINKLKQYLQTTSLTGDRGLSLVWSDMPVSKVSAVDIKVRYNRVAETSWEIVSEEPSPSTSSPTPDGPFVWPPSGIRPRRVLLALLIGLGVGLIFATLMSESDNKLLVKDAPAGWRIIVNGEQAGITPCSVFLPQNNGNQITLELPDAPVGTVVILDGKDMGKTYTMYKRTIPANARELKLIVPR